MKKRSLMIRSLLASAALLAFGIGTAHADLLKDIREAKKIRIALDTGSPPYGFVDDAMKPVGSDVETAQLLAQDLGVALEMVQTTSPNRIPFLQTGKADIVVASLSVTPEREKVIDFSVPYAQILAVIAGPKAVRIASFVDLKGQRVATTRGSNDATLVTAAVSGQADIVATSPAIVSTVLAKAPQKDLVTKFTMSTVPLGIGMRKNEAELKAWINDWIAKNTANGKLAAIYKKYHSN